MLFVRFCSLSLSLSLRPLHAHCFFVCIFIWRLIASVLAPFFRQSVTHPNSLNDFRCITCQHHRRSRPYTGHQGKNHLRIGPTTIEYNDQFKLFVLCRRSNPRFDAKIYSHVIVINFNITAELLANRMLHMICEAGDKRAMAERSTLATTIADNQRRSDELEDGLLTQITLADGNFTDNPDSMNLLSSTKDEMRRIDTQLLADRARLARIDERRNDFASMAKRAAGSFMALADMMTINVFYQYHIDDFVQIFEETLATSDSDDDVRARLSSERCVTEMINDLNKRIYHFGSMGMRAKDKLIFSLRLAMELELCSAKLNHKEIEFLLNPAASVVAQTAAISSDGNCFSDWLSDEQYVNVHLLATALPHTFDNLWAEISGNVEKWRTWHRSPQPETNVDGILCGATNRTNFQVIFRFTSGPPCKCCRYAPIYSLLVVGIPKIDVYYIWCVEHGCCCHSVRCRNGRGIQQNPPVLLMICHRQYNQYL